MDRSSVLLAMLTSCRVQRGSLQQLCQDGAQCQTWLEIQQPVPRRGKPRRRQSDDHLLRWQGSQHDPPVKKLLRQQNLCDELLDRLDLYLGQVANGGIASAKVDTNDSGRGAHCFSAGGKRENKSF